MLGGAGPAGGDDLLTVTVVRDEHGYGMKVSGDNPVYVQSVKEHGAAWRAGLRAGDRILRVDCVPVHKYAHQQVVHMIRANPSTVLTVQQNTSRLKTPITAPVPVNSEKQRQLEVSKAQTVRLMLEQEQKYIRDLRNDLLKVPDVRKQAQLESAEQRCSILQHEIDTIMATQNDSRGCVPVLHVRSQSSPEHLDHEPRTSALSPPDSECWSGGSPPLVTPPPGTPPPPYHHPTQPCADPQRAIISMEEDEPPSSESCAPGPFSSLQSVLESRARTAVLLNWLLAESRCASAALLLLLTDAYRAAPPPVAALRRWAYEIHSTFLMPGAVLQLTGVDENMANEIEHVLVNEFDKEELLRNVFRKARRQAKEQLARQLSEFQVKRQVGLATLYGPDDRVLQRCEQDKQQELAVVERIMCGRLRAMSANGTSSVAGGGDAQSALLAALVTAALCLQCRPASVLAAAGGARASFLQREKPYRQKLKQIAKQQPQPFVVRGHHLQLQALTSVAHCHHCDLVIWGLAPQAYVCTDCKLRVHRSCARSVEEGCCLDGEHSNNRISRFMERIHPLPGQDSSEKKSRKSSGTAHFLNMERSFRKMEDDPPWDSSLNATQTQGDSRREGSTDEPVAGDVDGDANDTPREIEKENNLKSSSRGVNRAESCRERDAPRRGKHRNASDPNRLTAHHHHDLEPGAATAPSGSSSSSSLSSRSNESNTVAAEQQASQSDWSEEEDPLAAQWSDSLPPAIRDSLVLSARIRKRQEVIHELIVSEGSHVRWLKVLGVDFLKPLERQPSLLPAEELRALFPNLPGVRERHTKLYADLRAVRNEAPNHVVQIGPVADAMLNTLGEAGYAPCLSKFCRGQRMALDSLRERRRKNKELQAFLAGREQLPRCGRLQLRDLLACVWQRLTKYQLLLESILRTAVECDDEDGDSPEEVARLRKALTVAKDVLQSVDTAIRTAENEHRLRVIQSKLEVRAGVGGAECEELRRLELPQHRLLHEGELYLRTDSKRSAVLALLLADCLVLLQREGERFLLKPVAQPSHAAMLSPLIKWERVLFRPNAAVKNTFFLMNINGIQMHELSANTAAEYATWVKLIQEAPLARLAESKPIASHGHSRSTDDSGINVSRNPSDASEKSTSSAPPMCESERDVSLERDDKHEEKTMETEDGSEKRMERGDRDERDVERPADQEDRNSVPVVGSNSIHLFSPSALESSAALVVTPPAHAHHATRVYSHHERLRRLDEVISRTLKAKSAVVAEVLGIPAQNYRHLAELAVAETLGQVDICGELPAPRDAEPGADLHTLLLAAQTQANQLSESLSVALSSSETGLVLARSGRCDSCVRHTREVSPEPDREGRASCRVSCRDDRDSLDDSTDHRLEHLMDGSMSAAALATRLVGGVCGLQSTLAALLAALPAVERDRDQLRAELAVLRERSDRERRDYHHPAEDIFSKGSLEQSFQEHPSNGG
ncbi:rho guanine nucleotide exchange factor 12 isoform X2 [Danaus plexippus]|uniref:rho guanine nucleotide exchange factor 12 isoform X2 n=1 Tax=Danaus plexippus TaxID=13037 RepID=UPI002AB0AB9A|nr:rho guanine nucleotide exchange factor 12 isoform X2 [Danaus plexippus]